MLDLPFIKCSERTEFSDECYSALGRALFVAQRFEANCKALATLLNIKKVRAIGEAGSPDDPEFIEFIENLWKRSLGNNLTLLKSYGLPEEINSSLDTARKARNSVAHKITLGIEHNVEHEQGRQAILNDIATHVRHIAEGDKLIGFLIQSVTNEPRPSPSYFQEYPERVVSWVCETFDTI